MLFDSDSLWQYPQLVAAMLFGFIVVKGLVATLAAMVLKFPARVAWLAGVGLAQFGEFGFVLTQMADSHQLLDPSQSRPLLAAGFLSMLLTPLLLRAAPHIRAGERILAPLERLLGVKSIDDFDEGKPLLEDHIVIVGFGLAGRAVSQKLLDHQQAHVILELNADIVLRTKNDRYPYPIFYGDATSAEALSHAHLQTAKLLVLMIDDPMAAERVVKTAQIVAPDVPIFMRTRYLRESQHLKKLGAQRVVVEEVEGASSLVKEISDFLHIV
jgi:CPA2 family monovalent cation:H+ antiporter-2